MNSFKINYLFLFLFLFAALFSYSKLAQAELATPSAYIVTVNSFDLCEDATCTKYTRLGSTSKAFDIASASAGGDVGTYVDEITLEVGKTYTHARWNLNRAMTMKGTVSVSGTGGECATSANGTAGTETVNAYNALDQTEANLDTFMVDLLKGGDGSWPTETDYTSKGVQLTDSDFPSATAFVYIKKLTTPYTVADKPMEITMSFDVTNTLGAGFNGTGSEENGVPNSRCYYWVEDPSPIIAIK